MTEEQIALARRAVACPKWKWVPGMLAVEQAVPGMALSTRPVRVDDYWHAVGVWLPDLTDPATLGRLLLLVREAWADPRIHAAPPLYSHESPPEYRYTISHWHVYSPGPYNSMTEPPKCAVTGKTEAEALVKALEAAP